MRSPAIGKLRLTYTHGVDVLLPSRAQGPSGDRKIPTNPRIFSLRFGECFISGVCLNRAVQLTYVGNLNLT